MNHFLLSPCSWLCIGCCSLFLTEQRLKLNQLRDAEFMNKNNYSAVMCLTVRCQCDHVTTPNPKSPVLNFTHSHLVTLDGDDRMKAHVVHFLTQC